jgi:hypothetical protein
MTYVGSMPVQATLPVLLRALFTWLGIVALNPEVLDRPGQTLGLEVLDGGATDGAPAQTQMTQG